jgi:hypothetical protein
LARCVHSSYSIHCVKEREKDRLEVEGMCSFNVLRY